MRSTALLMAVLAALLIAACSKTPPPEIVLVTPEPTRPWIAAECTSDDAPWIEVPDADVRRSTGARNYTANKEQYRTLIGKRRACRASLRASFPVGKE